MDDVSSQPHVFGERPDCRGVVVGFVPVVFEPKVAEGDDAQSLSGCQVRPGDPRPVDVLFFPEVHFDVPRSEPRFAFHGSEQEGYLYRDGRVRLHLFNDFEEWFGYFRDFEVFVQDESVVDVCFPVEFDSVLVADAVCPHD